MEQIGTGRRCRIEPREQADLPIRWRPRSRMTVKPAVFWTPAAARSIKEPMLVVIGNVVIALLATSLFMATVRLSK